MKNMMKALETVSVNGCRIPVITDEIRQEFKEAKGEIAYPLTDPGMFRSVATYSEKFRKSLAAAILGEPEEKIRSVELLNPVSFGEAMTKEEAAEETCLRINGGNYAEVKPRKSFSGAEPGGFLVFFRTNIIYFDGRTRSGLLDCFPLPGEEGYGDEGAPEFLSTYAIYDIDTLEKFLPESAFFDFCIENLSRTDLAGETDRISGRLVLAEILNTKTWEDLRSIAASHSLAEEVGWLMYASNADAGERCR